MENNKLSLKLEESFKRFKKFLQKTPKEELDKIVSQIKAKKTTCPTVEEYFEKLNRLDLRKGGD